MISVRCFRRAPRVRPLAVCAALLWMMMTTGCGRGEQLAPGDANLTRSQAILHGWEFRFESDSAGEWQSFPHDRIVPFETPAANEYLYLRHLNLPVTDCVNPAVYFPLLHQSFEAVALPAREVVYRFGDLDRGVAGYAGWPFHLISAGPGSQGIELRFFSDYAQIGAAGVPLIGCRDQIIEDILREDIDRLVLAIVALAVGVMVFGLYLRRRLDKIYLSFALLAFDAGLYLLSNRTLRIQYVLWPQHMVWMYIEYISLYTLPLCLGFYFRQVVAESRVLRWTVNFMIVFVAGLFVAHLSGVPIYRTIFPFFQISLAATVLLLIPLFRAVSSGNSEARLITGGVLAFLLVAAYDLCGVLGLIPWPQQMISYGFMVLLIFLSLVVSKRYEEVRNRLQEYSRELESARNQLADYANNLEEIVAKRTGRLKRNLERVRWLKRQQDGDYFLIARLMAPFSPPRASAQDSENVLATEVIRVERLVDQKKKFRFKHWREEIGGDVCMAARLRLGDSDCVVCLNGDAMGKSIQGAGGAIVLSVAFQAILERERNRRRFSDRTGSGTEMPDAITDSESGTGPLARDPEAWLRDSFLELHRTFLPFEGGMLISAWLAVITESTGELIWINAEHPAPVILRDGRATFMEEEGGAGKLGVAGLEQHFRLERAQLRSGDVVISGSDGRDDVLVPTGAQDDANMGPTTGMKRRTREIERQMNEDEQRFVRIVEEQQGDLQRIAATLRQTSELTDDLSLLRVHYG